MFSIPNKLKEVEKRLKTIDKVLPPRFVKGGSFYSSNRLAIPRQIFDPRESFILDPWGISIVQDAPTFKQTSILRIYGVNSKSQANSLYEFSRSLQPGHSIAFQTKEDFEKNCQHIRNLVNENPKNLDVYYLAWVDKCFLQNSNGGHHLAAIYRWCDEQNASFFFDRVVLCRLERQKCRKMLDQQYLTIFHIQCEQALRNALESFEVLFYPDKHYERVFIAIPKSIRHALRLYRVIQNAGLPMIDFSTELEHLLEQEQKNIDHFMAE